MDRPKQDILEWYRKICLERGAAVEVGPPHYLWFSELTDSQIEEIIRVMLVDRANELTEWINATPQMKSEQDLFDYIETTLQMIARGYVGIQPNGSLGCYAPLGPEPSTLEQDEIDHRILASRPLFRDIVVGVLGPKSAEFSIADIRRI